MNEYNREDSIGRGAFGVTYKVRHKRTGHVFAMKCIPRGDRIDQYVEREIINHKDLQHPNIVRFKEVVLDDHKLGIVMEYVEKGLDEEVLFHAPFTEAKARKMFQMLIAGVSYFHSKDICHRDLKLENILLTKKNVLKICDFGLSKSSLHSIAKTKVGTRNYWAPEVQSTESQPGWYDGKLADIWSCGIVLYNMIGKRSQDWHKFDKQENIDSSCKNLGVTKGCKELILGMLKVNPEERITIEKVKKHPWYLENLTDEAQAVYCNETPPYQSEKEILKLIEKARILPQVPEIDEEDKASTSSQLEGEDGLKDTEEMKNGEEAKSTTSSQERKDRAEDTKGMKNGVEAINSTSSQLEGEEELKNTKEMENDGKAKISTLFQEREEVEDTKKRKNGAEVITSTSSKLEGEEEHRRNKKNV